MSTGGGGGGGPGLFGGVIPGGGTVVGDIIRSPIGALSPAAFVTAQQEDQRRKVLEELAGQGGRTAQRTQSRASQSATARGLTGGAGAASTDRAVANVLQNLALQEAQLQNQFINQDVQALASIGQLVATAAGAPSGAPLAAGAQQPLQAQAALTPVPSGPAPAGQQQFAPAAPVMGATAVPQPGAVQQIGQQLGQAGLQGGQPAGVGQQLGAPAQGQAQQQLVAQLAQLDEKQLQSLIALLAALAGGQ